MNVSLSVPYTIHFIFGVAYVEHIATCKNEDFKYFGCDHKRSEYYTAVKNPQ